MRVPGHDAASAAGGGWRRLRPPHVEFSRLLLLCELPGRRRGNPGQPWG